MRESESMGLVTILNKKKVVVFYFSYKFSLELLCLNNQDLIKD
jgi:hypothetical protein